MNALITLLLLCAAPSSARLLLSQKQALALAFPPGLSVERRTAYLTEDQVKTARKLGSVKIEGLVWTYYVGVSSQGVQGYAYFDTHLVRTMSETVMVVVEPDARLRFVELLSFLEPPDYEPNARWLSQFKDRRLDEDLMVRRGIRNMTGASLTSQALADSVRRVLAVDAILHHQKATIAP
jgi:hypothetical protein